MNSRENSFRRKLRRWRGKRTQSEAAAALDVELSTYRNWEQGRNEPTDWAKRMVEIKFVNNQ